MMLRLKPKNDKLLKESLDLISADINVTHFRVPDYLLDFWIEWASPADSDPIGEHNEQEWEIFLFALVKQHREKGDEEFKVDPDYLMFVYGNWQVVLSMLTSDKTSGLMCQPIKIFDFYSFNHITFDLRPIDLDLNLVNTWTFPND